MAGTFQVALVLNASYLEEVFHFPAHVKQGPAKDMTTLTGNTTFSKWARALSILDNININIYWE